MPGQDHVLAINQDRDCKAELFDAVGNLLDLRFGVGPCIALLRLQVLRRAVFNFVVHGHYPAKP